MRRADGTTATFVRYGPVSAFGRPAPSDMRMRAGSAYWARCIAKRTETEVWVVHALNATAGVKRDTNDAVLSVLFAPKNRQETLPPLIGLFVLTVEGSL